MKKIILMSLFLIISCSKNDDRLKEKAGLESESSTNSQIRVENESLAKKAQKMEEDLAKKNRFYLSLKGTYEGIINSEIGATKVTIDFLPSKSIFPVTRVRQLEEIALDLNELFLTAHVVQSDIHDPSIAVGCAGIKVVDDIKTGELSISSEGCPNLYKIKLTDRGSDTSKVENAQLAQRLAREVIDGDRSEIDSILGDIKSTSHASALKFVALKIAE